MIESKPSMDGIPSQDLRQVKMRGHGKVKTIRSGVLPEVLPREINQFLPIQQMCTAFHAPFRCPRAQCNGGSGKPNWARVEHMRAKQEESRQPDLRWGADAASPPVDFPTLGSQQSQSPSEDQQPMCAATAMMHGIPMGASSSWQGGCPPIHEHRGWAPPVAQNDVILPNPGYRVEANIWHLDIRESALRPGPIASLLRHCTTLESPPIPSYLNGGPQPADDIQHLKREASMENLLELQSYAERLQFEATCVRLWSNGIQEQIMEETVQTWISRMIGELNRLRRVQPAWVQQLQAKANQQRPSSIAPAPAPVPSHIPVKATRASKNPSMSSAPRNAPFPNTQGADPWAAHQSRSQ